MTWGDLTKPAKGSHWLASKQRRAERVAAENDVMRQAKVRDGYRCRFPGCEYMSKKPRLETAHQRHRGIGGNPDGSRTTLPELVTLCWLHHAAYDRHEIDIQPLSVDGFNGPAVFYVRSESGKWVHVATEQRIGVSEARS